MNSARIETTKRIGKDDDGRIQGDLLMWYDPRLQFDHNDFDGVFVSPPLIGASSAALWIREHEALGEETTSLYRLVRIEEVTISVFADDAYDLNWRTK